MEAGHQRRLGLERAPQRRPQSPAQGPLDRLYHGLEVGGPVERAPGVRKVAGERPVERRDPATQDGPVAAQRIDQVDRKASWFTALDRGLDRLGAGPMPGSGIGEEEEQPG